MKYNKQMWIKTTKKTLEQGTGNKIMWCKNIIFYFLLKSQR